VTQDPVSIKLDRLLRQKYPSWAAFIERARALLPSGVTHDGRYAGGGPVLPVARGDGARKWDVDGNEFVDYWMGHGSLILGHANAPVVEAVRAAAGRLTHAGGCHMLELDWAQTVRRLVPSAERVRFVGSGTEAVILALRLARAKTRRQRILKLDGHFHGWSDFTLAGLDPPFDRPSGGGLSVCAVESTVTVPAVVDAMTEALATREFAALILEPTGASGGAIPLSAAFLDAARAATARTGTVLIFDEVVTGFRVAPGGVQAKTGILPDLTCLAKILAGGLPGGAVAGVCDVMSHLEFSGDQKRDHESRVSHFGTFNANPLSAAAGVACLEQVACGEPGRAAENFAQAFRRRLNSLFDERKLAWCAYGADSVLHVSTSAAACPRAGSCDRAFCRAEAVVLKQKRLADLWLKKALWLEGVDWPGGKQAWTSQMHGDRELEHTANAFGAAIDRLRSLNARI
jgi:glutamate-1-semialdehyde 2,1-aminomutase